MPRERRRTITEPRALEALAHPVRLALIEHLMASGPATASACARAVGDSPSNCSYHLRVLAELGLVGEAGSDDGRERPWQALITGLRTPAGESGEPMSPEESKLAAISLQRDQHRARDYLARRDEEPAEWRRADFYGSYIVAVTPGELTELTAALDAVIRPYIAATRERTVPEAQLVHVNVQAFPAALT